MANKAILRIDVDDTQFRQFKDMFDHYRSEVGEMPEAWKSANAVLNSGMAAVVEQTHNINKNLHAAITAQHQFAKATSVSSKGMKAMAKYAKETYQHIFSMGKFVLKAGAWGAGLFAGATFGMDKLAGSVLNSAVSARGINTDIGRLRAYQTDYAQIGPANLPNSVYGAQRNMSQWGWLGMASGLSPLQAAQMDPVALSQLLLRRAHAYYQQNKNNPAMLSDQSAQMQAFNAAGLNREAVTLAGNTPESQIVAAQRQMQADTRRLDYTNKTVAQMQQFWRQLRIAGQALETDLSRHLAKLGPSMGGLITALEKDGEKLLNGLLAPANIDAAKKALSQFTTFLESGKAQADLKKIALDLETFGKSVMAAVRFINGIIHPKPFSKTEMIEDALKTAFHEDQDFVSRHIIDPVANAFKIKGGLTLGFSGRAFSVAHSKGAQYIADVPAWKRRFDAADSALGLPEGFTRARVLAESGGNTQAVSRVGALGAFQFMPSTAARYGVKDPRNPNQALNGYIQFMEDAKAAALKLDPRARGRKLQDMLVSEYDMGMGGFARFWKRAVKEGLTGSLAWEGSLPSETQTDIRNTQANLGARQTTILSQIARNTAKPVKVSIAMVTPTAARVAMQANAAR